MGGQRLVCGRRKCEKCESGSVKILSREGSGLSVGGESVKNAKVGVWKYYNGRAEACLWEEKVWKMLKWECENIISGGQQLVCGRRKCEKCESGSVEIL